MSDLDYQWAWNTPGWNVQTPSFPDADNAPDLPDGFRNIQITGEWVSDKGKGFTGRLWFKPSVKSVTANGTTVIFGEHEVPVRRGTLPTNFYVMGPAEDSGLTPWTYDVRGRIGTLNVDMTVSTEGTETVIDLNP